MVLPAVEVKVENSSKHVRKLPRLAKKSELKSSPVTVTHCSDTLGESFHLSGPQFAHLLNVVYVR